MVKVFELNHKWIFPCNFPAGAEYGSEAAPGNGAVEYRQGMTKT